MKKILCFIVGLTLAVNLPAQTPVPATKTTPAHSAGTNAPPKKPALADELRTDPLVPGPASVVASNVNVRGRAGLIGEVLTRVNQGDVVTVLEEITLKSSKPDEPSAWAKIALPPGAHVWVNALFVDEATKTVKPRRLNLRGGPGENYSVIGLLERGTTVKEIQIQSGWMEIEPPAGAYAFVAAQYLKQDPIAEPVVATPTPTPDPIPEPEPVAVTEPPPVVTTPVEPPTTAPEPMPAVPAVTPEPEPEPADEPLPPRIVAREGFVRGAWSIQAPSQFVLVSPDTGRTINYLHTTSTNLDLSRYKGLRIVVTGEEALDARWRNTPVITIQRIQVIQ